VLQLQFYPDSKILVEKAEPVERIDSELRDIIHEMTVVMKGNDGIGLAAPQVGINKRVFVIQTKQNTVIACINPHIEKFGAKTVLMQEGCLSLPGLYGDVTRPSEIGVTFTKLDGKKLTTWLNKMEARVFQHELDHLDGWLFPFYMIPGMVRGLSKPLTWSLIDELTNNLLEIQL
jgi:peptide deformylase